MQKTIDYLIIENKRKYFLEEDLGGGPSPATRMEWIDDPQKATRYAGDGIFEADECYKKFTPQDFIHPDRFQMPQTAHFIKIRVTEIMEIVDSWTDKIH